MLKIFAESFPRENILHGNLNAYYFLFNAHEIKHHGSDYFHPYEKLQQLTKV